MLRTLLIGGCVLVSGCATLPNSSELAKLNKTDKQIGIRASQMPAQGIQPGFESSLQLFLDNPLDQPVKFYNAEYVYLLNGKETKYKGSFAGLETIAPHNSCAQENCPVFLPKELGDSGTNLSFTLTVYAKSDSTLITGTTNFPVVISKLTSPFVVSKGKNITLELTEDTMEGVKNTKKIVKFMDDSYALMADLIGIKPRDGKNMAFRETLAHGFYARAGFPIILSEGTARKDLTEFDRGVVSYVWLHEMGHNFEYGHWYMFDHPACEFHANLKLVYVVDQYFKEPNEFFKLYKWGDTAEGQPTYATGKDWIYASFWPKNIEKLRAEKKDWKSIGNILMPFYIDLVAHYDWEPVRKMYKTYDLLNQAGIPTPDIHSAEEKQGLQFAILYLAVGEPILDFYKEWNLPITKEKIDYFVEKYNLTKVKSNM